MRNSIYIVAYLVCWLTGSALAQTPVTLEEALRLGQENRLELKGGQLQLRIAEGQEAKRQAGWLPQVNASADLRWNTQIQTSVLKDAPFANGQDVRVKFGVPFNNLLGAQADQKIYDAQSRVDRKLNQVGVESEQAGLEKLRIDVRQQITEAYYQAVFNREKLRLSEGARQRAQRYLEQAQTRFDAGSLLKTDFDRFGLDLSNAELTHRNNQREYALSLDNLRYRLNVPESQPVVPADSLGALFAQEKTEAALMGEPAQRIEVRQEELNRQTNLLNQQRERARLSPTVSAYGAYYVQQFNDVFNPFTANTWFPYNYLGLKVNIPLFDGRQTRLNQQEYRLRAQISQTTIDRIRADVGYETKSALNALVQARDNLTETRRNITQAQAILAVDRVRFDAGTLLLADFRNSEYTLQNAENNYLKAVYDVLVGQLQLKKALGKL
ncbi:TolC family protein [Arsenicibacter rosenii]|uniref:Transporter n=1 Tax=Arsenicibacter rosenii TaxID=1750698 RepID=A0A1S2VBI3_9BACT|nr:TolC family protein [Arsenicibacter rosenii]OIN56063.1 transporter [Arsenicibacter rosenii]